MRFILRFSIGLILVFAFFWVGLAIYFSYIDRNKDVFAEHLSSYFDRQVTIGELETTWQGFSPKVIVAGFTVHPNAEEVAAPMAFESLEASLSIMSIFSFDGSSGLLKPKTVVRWLLDQNATNWSDGSIVWQRQSGDRIVYKDISFKFLREEQNRSIVAGFTGSSDEIAFRAESHGNRLFIRSE